MTEKDPTPTPDPTPDPTPAPQPPAPADNTVNAHKHQRDIAKIEAERDAAKAEAEGYKALKDEFEQFKAEQQAEKPNDALKEAGCIDTVAASACLSEFDGDIAVLSSDILAGSQQTASTAASWMAFMRLLIQKRSSRTSMICSLYV